MTAAAGPGDLRRVTSASRSFGPMPPAATLFRSPRSRLSRRRLAPVVGRWLSLGVVTLCVAACGDEVPSDTLERSAFIGAWVEFRAAAAEAPDGVLPDGERSTLLADRGVTEADLARFVEVHGDDVRFMDELWKEVLDSLEARGLADEGPRPEGMRSGGPS